MNKCILLIVLILQISNWSYGQETHYFSMYFHAKVLEKTSYQRKYYNNEGIISTEDYKNDSIELRSTITGTTDIQDIDEFLLYIRSLGQANKYNETFKNLIGKFTFYFSNGIPSNEIVFKRNKIYHSQAWDVAGKEQLVNGTGKLKSSFNKFTEDEYQEYIDSILVTHYIFNHLKNDTIHLIVDKQAEPREGIQSFYQHLVKILNYPLVARFVGKEGKVFIQFMVDENGKLKDFQPKSNEGYGFETRVIKKLESLPNWNAAVFKGRNVKTRFVLPITYKLTD